MSELTNVFTNIADAIRSKTGSSATMTPAQMATEIANIPSGGGSITKVELTIDEYDNLPLVDKEDPSKLYIIIDNNNYLYKWDFTKSLRDEVQNKLAVLSDGATLENNGVLLNNALEHLSLFDTNFVPIGKTIEVDVRNFEFKGNSGYHVRFIMTSTHSAGAGPLIYRARSGWSVYYKKWGNLWNSNLGVNDISGKTIKIVFTSSDTSLYIDNIFIGKQNFVFESGNNYDRLYIGGCGDSASGGDQCYDMIISGVRIYENED